MNIFIINCCFIHKFIIHFNNKLIRKFRFYENIKKADREEIKYKKFAYFPALYEKYIYALPKLNINLISYPLRKFKGLICTKINTLELVAKQQNNGIYRKDKKKRKK